MKGEYLYTRTAHFDNKNYCLILGQLQLIGNFLYNQNCGDIVRLEVLKIGREQGKVSL